MNALTPNEFGYHKVKHGFFGRHRFGPWGEVQRDEYAFSTSNPYQTRECEVCGYVQRRWL